MDPLTMIGVGSGILSSLFGARSQSKQLKEQRRQFEEQQKLAKEQLALAKEAQRQGLATQVDAAGNITAYDNATNTWKTILSVDQQQLLDASEQESLQQLTRDAPLSRSERERSAASRSQDQGSADALRSQVNEGISGRSDYTGDAATRSLRLARERAVSQGFDDVSNTLSTQAVRSGAGGLDRIGSSLARARSQAIAQTMGNPDIEGRQLAAGINSGNLMQDANLYNMMATRASNPNAIAPNVSTDINSAALSAARNAGMQGLSAAGTLTNAASNIMGNTVPAPGNVMGELFGGLANLAQSPVGGDIYSAIGGLFTKKKPVTTGLAGGGVY